METEKLSSPGARLPTSGADAHSSSDLSKQLIRASKDGDLNEVKYLVEEKHVDPDSCRDEQYNSTPLHWASQYGHLDIVKYLVEERNGDHSAAIGCLSVNTVQYLMISERRCDPICKGWHGRTPLHFACAHGKLDVMKYLVEDVKVDSSCRDVNDATPLHLAAFFGELSAVKLLVEDYLCDPGVRDKNGKTPADMAMKKGHNNITSYLSSIEKIVSTDLRRALVAQLKPYTRKATPTGKVLGSGTYGCVIELTSARETVAGKVFKMSSSVNLQAIANRVCGELITMVRLHHPNIVQCKGMSLLTDQPLPVLLMERMMSSLHAYLLHPDNSHLSVERKMSILRNIAKGLNYLHSQTPAIIHRDLTAKNVLLDSQLRAKIADFGNSRIMDLDPEASPETLTSLPGTLEYMPPEAQGGSVAYDPSLDVFSFGHLSLFTVTQTPVRPLLPPSYYDSSNKLCARSEVKRRARSVEAAEQVLSENHSLVSVMKRCLHNNPAQRPRTGELVTRLPTPGSAASTPADTHSPSHESEPVEADSETDNSPTEKSSSATGRHANFKPDMINLRRLSTHAGVINIMEETATKYRHIGVILLNDRNGKIVDRIEKSAKGEPLEAVHMIYAQWMREDVDYSWRKLTQCFRECDLNVLASNIEKHFGLHQSTLFGTGPCAAVESRLVHVSSIRESGAATNSDQDFVYQFRLILLGDSGVGKSSIFCQFKEGIHPNTIPTVGFDIDIKLIEVRGYRIQLQLWDTGGREQFRAISPAYYRDAVGGLLVFDITNRQSLDNLSVWLKDAQKYAGPYKPVFILVGNKTDQAIYRKVSKEAALSFATQHDMDYYETSAMNGSNVEEVFHKLTDKILTLVDGEVIKIEEGWRGVKRGKELSHTLSGRSYHIGRRYSTSITLGELSDDDRERNKGCCCC